MNGNGFGLGWVEQKMVGLLRKCRGVACWVVFALAGVASSWAQEQLVREVAFVEDKSGELTFSEVLTRAPQPYNGLLSCGYSASTWWVRVTLASAGDGLPVVLSAWPQFLDEIALFDPLAVNAPPRMAGDKYPMERGNEVAFSQAFLLQPWGEATRQYWLRLRSESSVLLSLSALPLGRVDAAGRSTDLLNDLFIGFLFCTILWAIAAAGTQPDRLIWAFALKQVVHLWYFVFLMGYARIWFGGVLSPKGINLLTNLLVVSVGACSLGFHYQFVALHKGRGWALKILVPLLLSYPLELVLILAGHARLALHARMIFNLCGTFILLVAALGTPARIHFRRPHQCLPRKVVVGFYCFLCAVLLVLLVPFVKPGVWADYVKFTFCGEGLMTGMGVMVLIYWRSLNTVRLHARRGYKAMQLGRRLKDQRARNLEQQHFISMLAHELKTPLSVVRLSLSSGAAAPGMARYADQAVRDMSGIIERCVKALQLETESPVVFREPCDVLSECEQLRTRLEAPERVVVSARSDLGGFQTDIGLFKVIVGNLLDNALKYGEPTEPVLLQVGEDFQEGVRGLSLVVESQPGPAGFPDGAKVFQKFYRSVGAQRSVGAGLGLFLVQGITRLLKGGITYSRREKRAVFSVWLPW